MQKMSSKIIPPCRNVQLVRKNEGACRVLLIVFSIDYIDVLCERFSFSGMINAIPGRCQSLHTITFVLPNDENILYCL